MDRVPLSPEELRRRAAAAWLADANAELANALSLAAHPDEGTAPFASAFHAQQAVEKGIKALLVWHNVAFPSRHDLGLLLDLVPAGATIKDLNVRGLSVYAVDQRYAAGAADPMNLIERPTWDDAQEAIAEASTALARVLDDLSSAGWALPG
jgi:HEPN domain-containing protein